MSVMVFKFGLDLSNSLLNPTQCRCCLLLPQRNNCIDCVSAECVKLYCSSDRGARGACCLSEVCRKDGKFDSNDVDSCEG